MVDKEKEKSGNMNDKSWELAMMIMGALGALIILGMITIGALTQMGINSIKEQILSGDATINKRLDLFYMETKSTNDCVIAMQKDITRIDTIQQSRLEREKMEFIKGMEKKK